LKKHKKLSKKNQKKKENAIKYLNQFDEVLLEDQDFFHGFSGQYSIGTELPAKNGTFYISLKNVGNSTLTLNFLITAEHINILPFDTSLEKMVKPKKYDFFETYIP